MNIFQNFTIKSRFNFINIFVIALILIIAFFLSLTFNKIYKYNKYNDDIDKLRIQYLNLRRYEQHFLLRYTEDPKFFISGENKYINKFKNSSEEITFLTNSILENPLTETINLTETVYEIIKVHSEYSQIFNELSEKVYKRGYLKSGIIGELKASSEQTLKLSDNNSKKVIHEMIRATDDYLYSNNEEYYSVFLKKYEQLISFDSQNQNFNNIEDSTENQIINYSPDKFHLSLNKFKNNFSSLVKIDKILGRTYEEGLEGSLRTKSHEFDKPIEYIYNTVYSNRVIIEKRIKRNIFIFFGLIAIFFFFLFWRFSRSIVSPLIKLRKFIKPLSLGVLPEKEPDVSGKDEITYITKSINNLVSGLIKTTSFANAIGVGEYTSEYKPLSDNDSLGNALIEMRENLISSGKEEEKRKDEDEIRTWTNIGLTKFNDILRQNQGNIKEMSIAVISNLVKFINANQGGMFVFNDDEDDRYLELTATYAYGKEKKKTKKIYPGEGMIGMVALEKETVYMTEIPETYITITSGLGGSVPKSLLITPMIVEEEIIGVIELASFNELNKHEIEFVKTLSENIASSLSTTKINQRTAVLLEQSQKQEELMKVQEEEMRQNFEELQQVQEESSRNAAEMTSILDAIDSSSSVFNIDANGIISSVNQQFLMLTDMLENKIIGVHHKDFFDSKNDEEYNLFWEMLLSGENIQKDEYLKIDDIEFWFSVVYRPIVDRNGKVLYIFSVGTNLTESKKLEQELKENIIEVNKAKKEIERKQHILENTNEMLKANESTLQSAVENAMKQRKELTKKVEEIEEEEALLISTLEGINQTNVTAQFDLEGKILSVNKIFNDLFGYTNEEIINKKNTILLKEQYISSDNYKKLWEDLKSGKHVSGNFTFQGKDNKTIFLQGTYTAIKNRRGKTTKIFLIGFNTTDLVIKSEELKARETELQFQIEDMQILQDHSVKQQEDLTLKTFEIAEKEAVSESRLEGINQTNIVIEFDKNRKIKSANKKFSETFGYKEKEALDKNCQFIMPEDIQKSKKFISIWENLEKGKTVTDTFDFLNKKKGKIFIHGTFTPIKDASGKTKNVILVGFDITDLIIKSEELKARETELQFQIEDMQILQDQSVKQQEDLTVKTFEIAEKEAVSESRLEGINQTNIVIEFDKDRKIKSANKKFTETFGYKEKEALDKNCQFIMPEDILKSDKFKGIWDNLGKGKTVTDTFNFLNKKKEKIFVHGTFTPIKNTSGKTKNVILIGFDITELIMRTEELKARETELEFQIQDLKILQEKLKNK